MARNVQFVDGKGIESMRLSMQTSTELISGVGGGGGRVCFFVLSVRLPSARLNVKFVGPLLSSLCQDNSRFGSVLSGFIWEVFVSYDLQVQRLFGCAVSWKISSQA